MKKVENNDIYGETIGGLEHLSGLPLAEGTPCSIRYGEDSLTIEGGGSSFTLNYSSITDLGTKTKEDVERQYVSSAGGAVAGALLFGPIGAYMGGRTKEKKRKKISNFFVITYKRNEEIKSILFSVQPIALMYIQRNNIVLKNYINLNGNVISLDGSDNTPQDTKNASEPGWGGETDDVKIRPNVVYENQKGIHNKQGGCFVYVITAIIVISILSIFISLYIGYVNDTTTVHNIQQAEEIKPVFDAQYFYKDGRTVTEQELKDMIGEPVSVDENVYTNSKGLQYNIRTLIYDNGNYEYKFCGDRLQRISIFAPISFNSVDDLLPMFGCKKTGSSMVNNTGAAYRVRNCGVYDLWIGYESGKTQWVHISYSSIFSE